MRNFFGLALIFLLQGCTGVSMLTISSRDLKGRDVDEVVATIMSRGLSCGREYQERDIFGGGPYGAINCGAKGSSPICPASFRAYLLFDLNTRKVLSLTKDERENCF
jgi:hypothetical protein